VAGCDRHHRPFIGQRADDAMTLDEIYAEYDREQAERWKNAK
jgi:hypothetical protein